MTFSPEFSSWCRVIKVCSVCVTGIPASWVSKPWETDEVRGSLSSSLTFWIIGSVLGLSFSTSAWCTAEKQSSSLILLGRSFLNSQALSHSGFCFSCFLCLECSSLGFVYALAFRPELKNHLIDTFLTTSYNEHSPVQPMHTQKLPVSL